MKIFIILARQHETSHLNQEIETPISHTNEVLPHPVEIDSDQLENLTTKENPSIALTLHPVVSKLVSELDTHNQNLIFNDLIQEAFITKNKRLENLVNKFLYPKANTDTYEKMIQNLIRVYTHDDGLYKNINDILRNDKKATFLGSSILVLNDAIRSNFHDLRFDSKCFRKANLIQAEFDEYYRVFNSKNKSFLWKSFVSATKTAHTDIRNNINSSIYDNVDYNTVFTIEFSSDSWGLDISNLSLSKYDDEVILPANSIFEIVNLYKDEKDQLIHIGLVKLDKNIESRTSKINRTWNNKGLKIVEKEINLVENELSQNNKKFFFAKDNDNVFKLKFGLLGPKGTFYENGIFQVNIFIPEGYPNNPPNIKFLTKIYHPNVSFESGDLDNEIIKKLWRPSLSIAKLINVIFNLLITPNENYENLNTVQKKEFSEEKEKFAFNAIEATRRFADFSLKISDYMRKNRVNENEAKFALLALNAFQSS